MRNLYKSLLKSVSCLCSCNAGNSADRFQQKSHGAQSSFRSRLSGTGNGSPAARSLALESLEDRMLLSASNVWSGIDTINWSSSTVGLDVFQNNIPEVIQAVNIDSDSDSDLIAINYPEGSSTSGRVTVYQNDGGSFVEKNPTVVSEIPAGTEAIFSTFFFDADKDGADDDFVVIKEGTNRWTLSASVYTRDAGNTYTRSSVSTIDLSSSYADITNITSYVLIEINGVASGSNIALNLQTYARDSSQRGYESSKLFGLTYDAAVTNKWSSGKTLLDWNGDFNSSPLNIVEINNVNYVACYPGITNALKFVDIADSNNVIDWNFSNIPSIINENVKAVSVNWVTEKEGTLFFGCSPNSTNSYYVSAQFSTFSKSNQTCSTEVKEVDAFEESKGAMAVIGNFNSATGGVGDLLICDSGKNLAIYSGVGNSDQIPTFDVSSSAVLSDPDWHSVYVADLVTSADSKALGTLGKDGVKDYIFVGRRKIWIVDGARYNNAADKSDSSAFLYEINMNVDNDLKKAYFVEKENDFIIIAQTESPHSVSIYNMSDEEGKITFKYTGTRTPDSNNYNIIQNVALGHFLDAETISVAITTDNKVFLYKTEDLTNQTAKAAATYDFSSLGKEISLGGWNSQNSSLDKVVLVTNMGYLYVFSYDNTTTLVKETQSYLINSEITESDEVYFSSGGNGELACLYANNHGGLGTLKYITESGTVLSNFKTGASSNIALTSGLSYKGLYFNYLNADAYYDIVAVAQNANGQTVLETWYGSSNGYYEKQNNSALQSVSGYPETGIVFASATADNTSTDVIIVGDRSAYIWKNISNASGRAGNITVLCQSFDRTAATDYNVASGTARTWIDEWSSFYLEIWADSAAAKISGFTVELDYNADYFTLGTSGVVFANNYSAGTSSSDNGKITLTVTGANVDNSYGMTSTKVLLGKVYFKPVGTNTSGVDLPESGKVSWVENEFAINVENTKLNGLGIKEAIDIDIPLYPVVYDLNDDNSISGSDYDIFNESYGKGAVDSAYNVQADFNPDGSVSPSDFDEFYALYGKSVQSGPFSSGYETIGGTFKLTGGRTTIADELAWRFSKPTASEVVEDLTAVALESESIFADLVPEEAEAVEFVAEMVPVAAPQTDYSILLAATEAENHKLWSILDEDADD